MNKEQMIGMWLMIGMIIFIWIYPHWNYEHRYVLDPRTYEERTVFEKSDLGHHFIWKPLSTFYIWDWNSWKQTSFKRFVSNEEIGYIKMDILRSLIFTGIIILVSIGLFITFQNRK